MEDDRTFKPNQSRNSVQTEGFCPQTQKHISVPRDEKKKTQEIQEEKKKNKNAMVHLVPRVVN